MNYVCCLQIPSTGLRHTSSRGWPPSRRSTTSRLYTPTPSRPPGRHCAPCRRWTSSPWRGRRSELSSSNTSPVSGNLSPETSLWSPQFPCQLTVRGWKDLHLHPPAQHPPWRPPLSLLQLLFPLQTQCSAVSPMRLNMHHEFPSQNFQYILSRQTPHKLSCQSCSITMIKFMQNLQCCRLSDL